MEHAFLGIARQFQILGHGQVLINPRRLEFTTNAQARNFIFTAPFETAALKQHIPLGGLDLTRDRV